MFSFVKSHSSWCGEILLVLLIKFFCSIKREPLDAGEGIENEGILENYDKRLSSDGSESGGLLSGRWKNLFATASHVNQQSSMIIKKRVFPPFIRTQLGKFFFAVVAFSICGAGAAITGASMHPGVEVPNNVKIFALWFNSQPYICCWW